MYRSGRTLGQQQRGMSENPEDWNIENAAALPFELEAELKDSGEPVTLLQTCNWPGHSPSYIGVDTNGESFIAAFHEVRIRDRKVVPNEKLASGGYGKKARSSTVTS